MSLPVKLTLFDGRPVFVNPALVTFVLEDHDSELAKVAFGSETAIKVKGRAVDVAEAIWPLPTDGR